MGFFDFVKNAGKSLFGSSDANAAEAIAEEVGDPSLADKIEVDVDGETVKISGDIPDQETKEKLILAAGNVEGVSKVEEDLKTEEEPAAEAAEDSDGEALDGKGHPAFIGKAADRRDNRTGQCTDSGAEDERESHHVFGADAAETGGLPVGGAGAHLPSDERVVEKEIENENHDAAYTDNPDHLWRDPDSAE